MKLEKIYIDGYKNLKQTSIEVQSADIPLAIIGNNGTGKSNLIEALLHVFIGLYYDDPPSFNFELEYKAHNKHATGITKRMLSDLPKTMKRWSYYFLTNWIRAPFTALRICLITFLFVLLHWPAWLVQIIPAFRFDLTVRRTRRYYYSWYAAIFIIVGLVLTTLF